jgi:RNA polymerase sigma-70 factor (ECF subfamily)
MSNASRPVEADTAALARAAADGDRAAFEELVAVTSPAVYALALRLVGNEHDAADVVQETYLRAFRSIDRFRGDAAVTTWLYRIAANCSSTHRSHRARRRHSSLDEAMAVVDTERTRDPESRVDASVERAALNGAIASLPASLRAVVVLRDVYDLPHAAIATELGISRAAAKVRLHRGRRQLRELLYPVHPTAPGPAHAPEVEAVVTPIRPAERPGRAASR